MKCEISRCANRATETVRMKRVCAQCGWVIRNMGKRDAR